MPQVNAASPATTTTCSSVAAQIAADRHAEAGRQRRPRVARAVAIVLAFGAQQKAVQPFVLPHRRDAIEPPGKHLVHVALMADVEDELVLRRFENAMQRDRQLDHAEIRARDGRRFATAREISSSRTSCASCGRSFSFSALMSAGAADALEQIRARLSS